MDTAVTCKPETEPEFSLDGRWLRFPQKTHDELGLVGNELYFHSDAKIGALVAKLGTRFPEIAVSQSGLEYLHTAVLRGDKITSGRLVLGKWEGAHFVVIEEIPVGDVVAAVKGIPPKDGQFGPYWWFNQDGTPYARSPGASNARSLDEPPF